MHYFICALGIILSAVVIIVYWKKTDRTITDIVLASVIIAILLELFTFNYASFMTYGNGYKQKTYNEGSENNTINRQADKTDIVINNLNSKLKDIYVSFQSNIPASSVNLTYDDEASIAAKTSAKNQVIANGEASTNYIKLNTAGKVRILTISLSKQLDQFGKEIGDITPTYNAIVVKTNERIPFNFSFLRWLSVLLLVLLVLCVQKYRDVLFFGEHKYKGYRKIVIGAILVAQITTVWFLHGTHEKIETFEQVFQDVNYDTTDQYHLLTIAMSKGQFNLNGLYEDKAKLKEEKETIKKLSDMEDPYSFVARAGIKYKWDTSFYKGNYYTYYGAVPVILIFLPIFLLTGKLISTRIVTMLLVILIGMIMCRFVYNLAKRRRNVGAWTVVIAMVGFFLTSQVLAGLRQGSFYDIAPLSEVMFALLGINIFYEAFHKDKLKVKMLVIGALCMALSVGCKATGLLASIVVAPIIIKGLYEQGINHNSKSNNKVVQFITKIFNRDNLKYIIAIAIPYIVIGLLIMIYNYVRYDNPFEFGVTYQLTVYNLKYSTLGLFGKIPSVLYKGIFALPRTSADFPFIHAVEEDSQYMGHFFVYSGSIGILSYPLVWLMALIPFSLKRGVKALKDRSFVIVATVMAFVMCYVVVGIGGISLRYSLEYNWLFFIPIIYVLFDLDEKCREKGLTKYFVPVMIAMLLATLAVSLGTCISPEWNAMYRNNPDGYYKMWKVFTFWR